MRIDPVPVPPAEDQGAAHTDHSDAYVIAILVFQQLLGSMTFPVAKFGLAFIEPFTFAFFRFVISAVVLVSIVRLRRPKPAIARADIWKVAGLGFLVVPFNQVSYLLGQSMTAAGHGALIFSTLPIWIFILALIHLKEKFRWRRAFGVAVGISGVGVIMGAGAIKIGTEYLVGDLIIVFAVIVWAYYTIWGKRLVRKYGAMRVTAYALASGSALYFPFGAYRALSFDYSGVTYGAWLSVLYIALGTSGVVYILWYWVLKYLEASRIAVFHNIQPVFASAVAYFFLNEPLGWPFVIGGVVVIAGVVITEV